MIFDLPLYPRMSPLSEANVSASAETSASRPKTDLLNRYVNDFLNGEERPGADAIACPAAS